MIRNPSSSLIGKRIRVHRNLNNGLWSVRYASEPVVHVTSIHLKRVLFYLNPKAQAKIAGGANRTVHAWATGEVVAEAHPHSTNRLLYDPRIHASFLDSTTQEVVTAAYFASFEQRPGDETPGCYINQLPF
jgi:hypothetical protein